MLRGLSGNAKSFFFDSKGAIVKGASGLAMLSVMSKAAFVFFCPVRSFDDCGLTSETVLCRPRLSWEGSMSKNPSIMSINSSESVSLDVLSTSSTASKIVFPLFFLLCLLPNFPTGFKSSLAFLSMDLAISDFYPGELRSITTFPGSSGALEALPPFYIELLMVPS